MGVAPLTWRVTSGSLPQGLKLNARSGVISGAPTQLGSFAFTVKVIDATKPTAMAASTSFTIRVGPSIQAAVYVTDGGYSAVQSFPLGSSGNAIADDVDRRRADRAERDDGSGDRPRERNAVYRERRQPDDRRIPVRRERQRRADVCARRRPHRAGLPAALALDSSRRLYVANLTASSITVCPRRDRQRGAGRDDQRRRHRPRESLRTRRSIEPATCGSPIWATDRLTEFPAGANRDIKPVATIGGGSSGLNGPHGLTLDGAGNLLVANLAATP